MVLSRWGLVRRHLSTVDVKQLLERERFRFERFHPAELRRGFIGLLLGFLLVAMTKAQPCSFGLRLIRSLFVEFEHQHTGGMLKGPDPIAPFLSR